MSTTTVQDAITVLLAALQEQAKAPAEQPEPPATHEELVATSPYKFAKGRVTITPEILTAVQNYEQPVIVHLESTYPAAVVVFATDKGIAVQNLANK